MAKEKVRKRKPKSERQSYKPTLDKLGDALKEVLKDITEELYADVDRGLDIPKKNWKMQHLSEKARKEERQKHRGKLIINIPMFGISTMLILGREILREVKERTCP